MSRQRVESSANRKRRFFRDSERSFLKIKNGTWAQNTALRNSRFNRERRLKDSVESHSLVMRVEVVSKPCVELALAVRGREFGELLMMPDCIESSRCVERDGPDLMSDIEGLHPLLEESKQHVQSKVTRSESELMI